MITLTLDLTDHASPALRQILADVRPGGPLGMVMGRALANTLKSHFRARNASQPNKLGGTRTNFWSGVAAAVNNPRMEGSIIAVSVSAEAINLKVFGGVVLPTNKKALAVPVNAKAYGVMARDMPGLAFLFARNGKPGTMGYLVEGLPHTVTRGKNKGTATFKPRPGGQMMYVLRKYTTHEPDPEALPPVQKIGEDLLKAAQIYLRRNSSS
jgi:hypothetical protein